MKNILVLLSMFNNVYAQTFPIVEEFNLGTVWTYTNGAGMQNYGGSENYATFNIGTTPYPNDGFITISSPIYDFTSTCNSNLTITYPIAGFVGTSFGNLGDTAKFQYFNNGEWTTVNSYVGSINTISTSSIPKTSTQFRFILTTDGEHLMYYKPDLNGAPKSSPGGSHVLPIDVSAGYVFNGVHYVYYYDIARFTIDCLLPLPISLVSLSCESIKDYMRLDWITASEINNWYFVIYRSADNVNWKDVAYILGDNKPSHYTYFDHHPIDGVNYYKVEQVDFDGNRNVYNTLQCYSVSGCCSIITYYNLLGQEVDFDKCTKGVYLKKTEDGINLKVEIIYK